MRILFILVSAIMVSCSAPSIEDTPHHPINWKSRSVQNIAVDSLQLGTSYLSVYAEIYSQTEKRTHKLTATVSLRNINPTDTLFISRADYYNTHGELVRSYTNEVVYIAPMETLEIVINEKDTEGGTGANFLFDWLVPQGTHEPYFEAVMISTSGQQGLSFSTRGIKVK